MSGAGTLQCDSKFRVAPALVRRCRGHSSPTDDHETARRGRYQRRWCAAAVPDTCTHAPAATTGTDAPPGIYNGSGNGGISRDSLLPPTAYRTHIFKKYTTHTYLYIHTYLFTHILIYTHILIHTHTYIYTHTYSHTYLFCILVMGRVQHRQIGPVYIT